MYTTYYLLLTTYYLLYYLLATTFRTSFVDAAPAGGYGPIRRSSEALWPSSLVRRFSLGDARAPRRKHSAKKRVTAKVARHLSRGKTAQAEMP